MDGQHHKSLEPERACSCAEKDPDSDLVLRGMACAARSAAMAAAVVCISAIVAWILRGTDGRNPSISPIEAVEEFPASGVPFEQLFPTVQSVPPIQVGPSERYAGELFEEGEPVIIRKSQAMRWPAMGRWTPEHFSKHVPVVEVHKSTRPAIRMHTHVHPLGTVSGVTWTRPWTNATVPSAEFFSARENQERGLFYYYFAPLASLPPALRADVGRYDSFHTPFRSVMEVNVWIGTRGIRTPTHYDVTHNMYVQVHGEKTFVLYPPEDHSRLYLFPRVHPSSRMSQVPLDRIDVKTFPRFSGSSPQRATLGPGDVLYIPPYWLHNTEVTGGDSMSVSICSESPQVELREMFLDQHLNGAQFRHRSLGLPGRVAALGQYLQTLLGGNRSRAAAFARCIHEERFERLAFDAAVLGLADRMENAAKRFAKAMQNGVGEKDGLVEAAVREAIARARTLLSKYSYLTNGNYRYRLVEWEIELANHMEDVVTEVLRDPLMLPAFFQHIATAYDVAAAE